MKQDEHLNTAISRRRILKVTAALGAAGAFGLSPLLAQTTKTQFKTSWRGVALGAEAELHIIHNSKKEAEQALDAAVSEIRRLESLFSLYDTSSLVSKLNRRGKIQRPPADFLALLSQAHALSAATFGGFDITVQPFWTDPQKPGTMGYQKLDISMEAIAFSKADMAVTLNGIAQGYITDKVTDILSSAGLKHILIDTGEIRAIGEASPGRNWQAAIPHGGLSHEPLRNQALAISSALTPVIGEMRPHLISTQTVNTVTDFSTVMVKAPTATLADGLSTGLAVLPEEAWEDVLQNLDGIPINVKAVRQDGIAVSYTA